MGVGDVVCGWAGWMLDAAGLSLCVELDVVVGYFGSQCGIVALHFSLGRKSGS